MTGSNSATPAEVSVHVQRLAHGLDLPIPAYQSAAAAGMDLRAALDDNKRITLEPGARALIPTGFIFQLPEGCEAQVRPRSGLALKHGVTVLNSPGTIDADYRGEIGIILINLGSEPFAIQRGDRIAQLVIAQVSKASLSEVNIVDLTSRGQGGFGSTGT